MNPTQVLLPAFLIGVVAGLRSLTAPAVVQPLGSPRVGFEDPNPVSADVSVEEPQK